MTMEVCETDCNIPHQQGGRTAIYVSGEAKTKLPQQVNRKQIFWQTTSSALATGWFPASSCC